MNAALDLIEQSISAERVVHIVDPCRAVLVHLRRLALGMGGSVQTFETRRDVRRTFTDGAERWAVETITNKRKGKQL